MLSEIQVNKVYLALNSTDLRKSIDGLAVLVQHSFKLDPFSPSLFVFCNRKRDKIKILYWSSSGFWLYYHRLEQGKFKWPQASKNGPVSISYRELRWLLDGLSIDQPKAHKEVKARTIL